MLEPKIITYQAALKQRIVKENDYFLIRYPDRQDELFRLVKKYTGGYVMWGPPMEEFSLRGKAGYDNIFTLADILVNQEYSCEGIFKEIHACGLPKKEYKVDSYNKILKILEYAEGIYINPYDVGMNYALAAQCTIKGETISYFAVLGVGNDSVGLIYLYRSDNKENSWDQSVRPEAIPNPTLRLLIKGHDGSKANPWICLRDIKEED